MRDAESSTPRAQIFKAGGIVLLVLVVLYVGSYLGLSAAGRYEPASIGLNGVKSYGWAPHGFVTNYQWNRTLEIVYLPLFCLDISIWHTAERAQSGRYPINEVDRKDIWKVYKALGI